jgi:hypothetical protein
MPAWLPEGDRALPTDSELRSLEKWCNELLVAFGNKPSPFPEGCIPLPGDNEQRLYQKITILRGS